MKAEPLDWTKPSHSRFGLVYKRHLVENKSRLRSRSMSEIFRSKVYDDKIQFFESGK